jgi:hypothetical protein
MSKRKRSKEFLAALKEMCREGGHARAAALSPARRSEIAKAAAKARWDKNKQGKKPTK